jgi:hypothetical protein
MHDILVKYRQIMTRPRGQGSEGTIRDNDKGCGHPTRHRTMRAQEMDPSGKPSRRLLVMHVRANNCVGIWDRTHEYMGHEPDSHQTCHPACRLVHLVLLWRHELVRMCDVDYTMVCGE